LNSRKNLDLALEYASNYGWHILPVHGITDEGKCTCGRPHNDPKEVGKHPASPNGQKDATTDLTAIAGWWTQNPDYNIGVFCKASGFFAIDIDPRSGGDDSFITLEERAEGSIIPTVEAITGEYTVKGKVVRGRHLLYRCNPNESFMKNLDKAGLKGIDVKHNGYIVISPSRHFSGAIYDWKPGHAPWEVEIPEAPEELLVCLTNKKLAASGKSSALSSTASYAEMVKAVEAYQPYDLNFVVETGIDEGHRAVELYRMACSIAGKVGTDALGQTLTVHAMKNINSTKVRPPLPEDGPNGLLMHVERAIDFVRNNPLQVTTQVNPSGKPLADSHDSAATEWVAGYLRGTYCWSKHSGWLGYEDGVWKSRSDEHLREAVRKIIHQCWDEARRDPDQHSSLATLKSFLSKARLSGIEALLRGLFEVQPDILDGHVDLLNAKNGVVDLKTGELLSHDPGFYFTKQTICDYKPNAKHPDWNKALDAIPDYASEYIQTLFGQGVTGYILSEDIALVLGGGGRNGKSTICDVTVRVLAGFAVLASPGLLTGKDTDHTTELADLVGKRFALLEEFPMRGTLNVSRLKRVVGTAEISARRMRQDNQTWDATHTLVITTNHEIQIPSGDDGTWRRLVKINFPFRYVSKPQLPNDRHVEQGLRERIIEGSEGQHEAALAWLVKGAMDWFANGRKLPSVPKEVLDDIAAWRTAEDSLGTCLSGHLELDADSYVAQQDLHALFKHENDGGGELRELGTFASALKSHDFLVSHGLKVERERHASKQVSRPNPLLLPGQIYQELPTQTPLIRGLHFK